MYTHIFLLSFLIIIKLLDSLQIKVICSGTYQQSLGIDQTGASRRCGSYALRQATDR